MNTEIWPLRFGAAPILGAGFGVPRRVGSFAFGTSVLAPSAFTSALPSWAFAPSGAAAAAGGLVPTGLSSEDAPSLRFAVDGSAASSALTEAVSGRAPSVRAAASPRGAALPVEEVASVIVTGPLAAGKPLLASAVRVRSCNGADADDSP